MNRERVRGIGADLGSRTSHTAIMARSLGIPTVVGLHDASEKLETGDEVLLDGYNGLLIMNPSADTLRKVSPRSSAKKDRVAERADVGLRETNFHNARRTPHRALGQHRTAGLKSPTVAQNGAEGVGLYRTEFLYLNRPTLPSEEEQYRNLPQRGAKRSRRTR